MFKKIFLTTIILFLILPLFPTPTAFASIEESFLIKTNNSQKAEKLFQELGIKDIEKIEKLQTYEISANQEAFQKILTQEFILSGEKNQKTKISATTNDQYFSYQNYLTDSNVLSAWNINSGNPSLIVATIDTGIDYLHEDLVSQMWQNASGFHGYDFVNKDNDPMDDAGHGTMIAGIIAATRNNTKGIAGVANVKLMAIKAAPANGEGEVADLARGIIYAADNGAKVINASLGTEEESFLLDESITYAKNKGVVIISSSGNEGNPMVRNPARNPDVVGVGAINTEGTKADYSNYGTGLSLVALGDEIISSSWARTNQISLYQKGTGTSFSTPQVTGVASLILSQDPSLSVDQVKKRLESSATKLPAMLNAEYSQFYGYGKLNAYNALTYDKVPPEIKTTAFFKNANGSYHVDFQVQDDKGNLNILPDIPVSNISTTRYMTDNNNDWIPLNNVAQGILNTGFDTAAFDSGSHTITIESADTAGNKQTMILATGNASLQPASKKASDYKATLTYQSPYPILAGGQKANMKLTFLNSGSSIWLKNSVHLGTTHPLDKLSTFADSSWVSANRIEMKQDFVMPGEYADFEFTITAPNSNGTYKEYFNLVADGVAWFSDIGLYWNIKVEPPSYHAKFIDQSPYAIMAPNEEKTFWVEYQNSGGLVWNYNTAHLGTSDPLDHANAFYNSGANKGWASPNRVVMDKTTINPGGNARFNFVAKAPNSKGTYKESFRPVIDGVGWLEDYGLYWNIEVK